ncbi:hypothetical protein [Wenxinia marina]|uniref:Uncharacterized protein n=1 Tax=Wenxinia marina DSM 24838 TaxID=1123501 RepID=A0A0D0QBM8_9RHOB|nr:hypothetical protein [Wenxinia marina]KIQ69677.1 hypothetical protein Wenmar_02041 [Wenxinia marina DSM 24838]
MARLVIFAFALLAVALGAFAVASIAGGPARARAAARPKEDRMPDTLRTVAYVALLLLMLGIVTGWLGGA